MIGVGTIDEEPKLMGRLRLLRGGVRELGRMGVGMAFMSRIRSRRSLRRRRDVLRAYDWWYMAAI
jgi:hypothetical protein